MTYHRITGYDNLRYYGGLYGVKDIDSKIDIISRQFRLKKWLDEFVEHYSKGMRIKLSLARALIHDPEVLLLDEPTLGLDARSTEYITSRLPKLKKTILYTTHYIEEAKRLSDRVVMLKNGRVAKIFRNPSKADIKGEMLK